MISLYLFTKLQSATNSETPKSTISREASTQSSSSTTSQGYVLPEGKIMPNTVFVGGIDVRVLYSYLLYSKICLGNNGVFVLIANKDFVLHAVLELVLCLTYGDWSIFDKELQVVWGYLGEIVPHHQIFFYSIIEIFECWIFTLKVKFFSIDGWSWN